MALACRAGRHDRCKPKAVAVAAQRAAPAGTSGGLYAPGDWMWRFNREAVLLLAGPRALLLQLAHPLVAAGVAGHSDFRREPVARLRRTLDAMLAIIYGTREEADAAAGRVRHLHRRVAGRLDHPTRAFPAGTPYRALDPSLLFWVQATLQDSALAAFECFVGPLAPEALEAQYQESKRMAPLFELPESELPPDHPGFLARFDYIVDRELEVTPVARELADAVLHPPIPLLPRFVGDVGSIVTLELLPPAIREEYGFAWDANRETAWRAARTLIRRTLPHWPDAARVMPRARRAERALQEN